ncbi:hypothetical protein MJO29_010969 [Puccinia striiformis f. sp. tritici]|nr:hypothetical protein Pst134EB_021670 [Puccinia striiformis f. sp. tritici]KAI7946442.1 hypothetical protein MJO29_010969 [Puccinia striiformis f. sp. tritici]
MPIRYSPLDRDKTITQSRFDTTTMMDDGRGLAQRSLALDRSNPSPEVTSSATAASAFPSSTISLLGRNLTGEPHLAITTGCSVTTPSTPAQGKHTKNMAAPDAKHTRKCQAGQR